MPNKPKFKIGDRVRVLPNGPKLKDYHGSWIKAMEQNIGEEYTIKKIFNPDITEYNIGPFYGYSLEGTVWIFDERNLELVKPETIEKKPKFKVGDKVKVLSNGLQLIKNYHGGWISEMKSHIGKEYIISKIEEPDDLNPFYGYRFKGIYLTFDERNLELVKQEKEENPANIIFKFKGNKIIAKREGGLKATASCHPDDKYDITVGMRIAAERLLDKEKKAKEQETTPIEGFYICVRGNECFSYGNIYKFENGKVKDNIGWIFGPYKEDQKINKTTLYIGNAIFKEIKWEYV